MAASITAKEAIMIFLQKNPTKGFSNTFLSKELELKMHAVRYATSELTELGYLYKMYGQGNGSVYKFKTDVPPPERPMAPLTNYSITGKELFGFLAKWANEQWQPRIFKSARNLPLGLGRLYELAVEGSMGASVEKVQVDTVRANLIDFKEDLQQTLKVVESVLNSDKLWDSKELPVFLLIDNVNVYDIQKLASELKRKN